MRALFLLLVGCAGADYTGTWTVQSAEFVTNDCADDGNALPTGTFSILADKTQIEIDFGNGIDPIDCDRNGKAFTCDEEEFWSDIQGSARLETAFTPSGTLGSELQATLTGTTSCEGADCATLEGLGDVRYPCAMVIDFTATL